ncbi:MAG: HAD-IB family hydrolase [Spirulina sp. SIO3F2]|nr:HAD-IB family hydrolase [Spirulina sp. SIO3F2]
MTSIPKTIIAAFDFDDTLTRHDSFLPFLRFCVGWPRFCWGLLVLSPTLSAYMLKLIPNWQAKEKFLTYFLAGQNVETLRSRVQTFATQQLPTFLRPEAIERLRWHQAQGHQVILVSASPELYLEPWAQTMGIETVLGSQLEVVKGGYTGRLAGKNCYGQEKVDRLQQELGELQQYTLYAYGDSKGDRALLAAADYPYYRCFTDDVSEAPSIKIPRWERGLILTILTAAALYLGGVLWNGAGEFGAALAQFPLWLIPLFLCAVFLGHCLRFVRWQWYLWQLGYAIPLGPSFQIFLASLALTASPGKAGEAIRAVFLKQRYQVPLTPSLAALACEQFTDAGAVILLVGLGITILPQGKWAIAAIALIQLVLLIGLQYPTWLKQCCLQPLERWSMLSTPLQQLEILIDNSSRLLRWPILLGAMGLAMLSWSLEGCVLYGIFRTLDVSILALPQAVVIHLASGIIGVLSLSPGGLGSNEAATVGLAMLYGVGQGIAITATVLIRLMTLWFAVAMGVVVMGSLGWGKGKGERIKNIDAQE